MKIISLLLTAAVLMSQAPAQEEPAFALAEDANADHIVLRETEQQRNERMAWWRNAKFGMFIHYGIYSGLAGEFQGRKGGAEWLQSNLKLDTDTYAAEALPLFKPAPGCTEEWAKLAEEAGCRYMVLTSKHHDGFALFDSEVSDYTSAKVVGRDIVKEYTEAARKHNLRVGFYHSVIDWHHPSYDNTLGRGLPYPAGQAAMLREKGIPRDHAAYQAYLHTQARELFTKYGKIDIIWWDYSQGGLSGKKGWDAPRLICMAHELQPGIVMNNRLYAYSGYVAAADSQKLDLRCGDFTTPEKRLVSQLNSDNDWEACITLGQHWGFNKNDTKYKSAPMLIRHLEQCAAYGGNLLLNISPRADGSITEQAIDLFHRIGSWMKVNGEAIYGSVPAPSITLPENWLAAMVGEETYIFPPAMQPKEDVVLRIPAHEIDTVAPSVLGQPGCEVSTSRVEEPGEDEPRAFMQFVIPASVWKDAVEGMPVIKLSNTH